MYYTKAQYLEALKSELLKRNVTDGEILEDFEQHFNIGISEGLSEEQVCEKLGSPAEIANQYAPEDYAENIQSTVNENQMNGNATQEDFAQNNYSYNNGTPESNVNAGAIVGVICLDVFVLAWAIPALFSLLISYWSVMASFFAVPLFMLLFALVPPQIAESIAIFSTFNPTTQLFSALIIFGIALIMSAFCIDIWKGFIKLLKSIGRLHYKAFTGKNATF